jgi:hypothetical protein
LPQIAADLTGIAMRRCAAASEDGESMAVMGDSPRFCPGSREASAPTDQAFERRFVVACAAIA